MQLNVEALPEDGLQRSAEQERAASPEDPVQVEGIVHGEVAKLDGAVFLQGPVQVPQVAVDDGKSGPLNQYVG